MRSECRKKSKLVRNSELWRRWEEREEECKKCPELKQALNTRELWWVLETRRSGVLFGLRRRQVHAPRGIALEGGALKTKPISGSNSLNTW